MYRVFFYFPFCFNNVFYCFRARLTMPHFLQFMEAADGTVTVVTKQELPAKKKLGPFEARRTTQKIETSSGFVLMVYRSQ